MHGRVILFITWLSTLRQGLGLTLVLEAQASAWDNAFHGTMSTSKSTAHIKHADAAPDVSAPEATPRRSRKRTPVLTSLVVRRKDRINRDTPYDKLLESVYDGVFITDRQGVILDYNERVVEIFRMPEERFPALPVVSLISGADEGLIETILMNLSQSRYTLIGARCIRGDGTAFHAEIAVNQVDLDRDGQLCFFVRDVTVRRQALDQLEAAVERLQAHDRARTEFVSNVSHELRTPLTSMIYAVGNMLRGVVGPLPEKAIHYLERLESDCRRLLGTVNDILDLRQLETGTLELIRARTPLGPVVRNSVEALRVQADAKRQRLQFEFPGRECFVSCDLQKIERVVMNVVGNAIKFTPDEGTVVVYVGIDPADPAWATVTVRDNGVGIPREVIPRVTQRYFKVGDHPNGAGLGLSISREIVELHGGTLSIDSPVPGTDKGTLVNMRLPAIQPLRVMIVSSNAFVVEPLKQTITGRGYVVQVAEDGRTVLDSLAVQSADLLILDMRLSGMDGTELLLQVRNDKRFQRLPTIVITHEAVAKAVLDVLQRLSATVLPMPWRDADLLGRIAMAFCGRGSLIHQSSR